jgi:hypothetical protein
VFEDSKSTKNTKGEGKMSPSPGVSYMDIRPLLVAFLKTLGSIPGFAEKNLLCFSCFLCFNAH